jgi:mannose-6-phosphate isomerase-like protein (cupin superfamily)
MRALTLAVAAALTFCAASAVRAAEAQPTRDYISAAEVAALEAKAKAERKDGQANVIQRLLTLAPYAANLEYRASIGPAAVHEKEAELFYVVDGSATLVTGGKLTGETRPNPANLSGTGIEGGTPRKVSKGDMFIVPENTPHWFSAIDGVVVLMSLHVPRG